MLEKPRIIEERRVCLRVCFRDLRRKQRDRSEMIRVLTPYIPEVSAGEKKLFEPTRFGL